jgi:hypothetical protein
MAPRRSRSSAPTWVPPSESNCWPCARRAARPARSLEPWLSRGRVAVLRPWLVSGSSTRRGPGANSGPRSCGAIAIGAGTSSRAAGAGRTRWITWCRCRAAARPSTRRTWSRPAGRATPAALASSRRGRRAEVHADVDLGTLRRGRTWAACSSTSGVWDCRISSETVAPAPDRSRPCCSHFHAGPEANRLSGHGLNKSA